MPIGVNVTTSVRTGPSNASAPSGRFIIAGLAERGPVNTPSIVRSLAQFESVFGVRTPYNGAAYDSARLFWEEGGGELVFVRVAGDAAAPASLQDEGGLVLTATSPGAWGNEVEAYMTASGGGMAELIVTFRSTAEKFSGRTYDEIVRKVNGVSNLVRASLASGDPEGVPTEFDVEALQGGDDDRGSVGVDGYMAALDTVGGDLGTGAVALPGMSADLVGGDLLAYAQRTRRIAFLAMGEGDSVEDARAFAAEAAGMDGAEFGALLYPHVRIPDGTGSRTVSPEALAAAVRSRAHSTGRFWEVPAGDNGLAQWVLETSPAVDTQTNDALADDNITAIVTTGTRIRPYGWWSLSADTENFKLLTARDVLNVLAAQITLDLEEFVFSTVDGRGQLLSKIESTIRGRLDPIAQAGGFYARIDSEGNELDPGYSVRVDSTINTASTLANNTVLGAVAVRLSPSAALIEVEITKSSLTAAV